MSRNIKSDDVYIGEVGITRYGTRLWRNVVDLFLGQC